MAERIRTNNTVNTTTNGNAPAGPRNGAPGPAVRRNLFQNGQNARAVRRPAPTSSNSSETLRVDADMPHSDSSEIVVRDRHGEIELGDPPSPDLEDQGEPSLDCRQESEHERQRLADAVKQHQINNTAVHDQPEELLDAVRASLRAKVAALSEDNWMYAPDEQNRGV